MRPGRDRGAAGTLAAEYYEASDAGARELAKWIGPVSPTDLPPFHAPAANKDVERARADVVSRAQLDAVERIAHSPEPDAVRYGTRRWQVLQQELDNRSLLIPVSERRERTAAAMGLAQQTRRMMRTAGQQIAQLDAVRDADFRARSAEWALYHKARAHGLGERYWDPQQYVMHRVAAVETERVAGYLALAEQLTRKASQLPSAAATEYWADAEALVLGARQGLLSLVGPDAVREALYRMGAGARPSGKANELAEYVETHVSAVIDAFGEPGYMTAERADQMVQAHGAVAVGDEDLDRIEKLLDRGKHQLAGFLSRPFRQAVRRTHDVPEAWPWPLALVENEIGRVTAQAAGSARRRDDRILDRVHASFVELAQQPPLPSRVVAVVVPSSNKALRGELSSGPGVRHLDVPGGQYGLWVGA